MQTQISSQFQKHPDIQEIEQILRSCVHCGFCTATCPTYQLLGDELDGPRGRIYLLKQMLEGGEVGHKTQLHLDRCLTCRACETTCPSGVRYGRLLETGREILESKVSRPWRDRLKRYLLRKIIPYPKRLGKLMFLGKIAGDLLPWRLTTNVTTLKPEKPEALAGKSRKMLVLQGCVQSVMTPQTNAAAAKLLSQWGIQLLSAPAAGCCGAVSHHLSAGEEALAFVKNNIDAWWPFVEQGVEAIVITASGCGAMVKEYGLLLQHDPAYAGKAKRISELARDIAEIVAGEDLSALSLRAADQSIAFHNPCSLQHGQQLPDVVEDILVRAGFRLTRVRDSHLCCGSAGTYSLLQPELSQRLLENKLAALQAEKAGVIATANIGCQMHLASRADVPVVHWLELLVNRLPARPATSKKT